MIILLQIGTPEYGEAFRIARRVAAQGKKMLILFTGEGCKLTGDTRLMESLDFARLFALRYDAEKPAENVELIDYDGWVKLLAYCRKTVSWT